MSNDWARLLNTTTPDYLRDVEANIMRNRKLLALMQAKGRVSMSRNGTKLDWKVEYKQAPLVGFSDGDTVTFSRRDRHKTAELGWRAYVMTDAMSEQERLQNDGTPAIIKNYTEIIEKLVENIDDQFGDELYVDGNAAGNSRRLHGIESFLGAGANQANGYMLASDTYANLSTAQGTYGGTFSGTYPVGRGDAHYDFFSPVLVDYTNATAGVFSSATKTWQYTCQEATRMGIGKSRRMKSKKGMLDMVLQEEEMFRKWKDFNDSRQQINITRGEGVGLVALGFTDVMNFDGVEITSEYGMPADTAYGFNTMQMELNSLQPSLFVPKGPFYDEASDSWRFQIRFYGNGRFNPKFQVKWKNYT